MALVPPLGFTDTEVRALLAPIRNDLSIAVCNCQNPFAVGAIIRVAHSFLVREIIVIGEAPYYAKASMGMQRYESIVTVADDDAFFAHTAGRPIWSIEKERASVDLYDVEEFPRDVVLVVGSERFGVSSEILDRSAAIVGIPMYGVNHSFPVTVAAGMVLGEWGRQRYRRTRASRST